MLQARKYLREIAGKTAYTTPVPLRVEDNFERFSFNSKHRIYLFIDNPSTQIDFSHGGSDRIIRFAPKSNSVPAIMHKNHAFLNMEKSPINFREVAPGEDWGLENETGYALNFWNTDEYGDTIKDIDPHNYKKYYLYAMNIHLILPKAKLAAAKPPAPPGTVIVPDGTPQDAFLPIILDPDTGNMGGTP